MRAVYQNIQARQTFEYKMWHAANVIALDLIDLQ